MSRGRGRARGLSSFLDLVSPSLNVDFSFFYSLGVILKTRSYNVLWDSSVPCMRDREASGE